MSPSHSYLGNGLYAARLATLGALGADGRVSSTFLSPLYSICTLCHSFINAFTGTWQSVLVFVFPGLDWKVFTSSCLPKKFREDVTFGGTTYKVSGIPDGKMKAPWGFDCLPSALDAAIRAFLSQLWNTIEYSTIQSLMRTFIRWSFCNLGAKRMFCHPLSLCLPSWTIILQSTMYLNETKTVS